MILRFAVVDSLPNIQPEYFILSLVHSSNGAFVMIVLQDICISAVKEKDIEAKLSQVKGMWSGQILTLMAFKDRGELMLNGAESAEILTNLEDSLMVLGSLLSNRCNRTLICNYNCNSQTNVLY